MPTQSSNPDNQGSEETITKSSPAAQIVAVSCNFQHKILPRLDQGCILNQQSGKMKLDSDFAEKTLRQQRNKVRGVQRANEQKAYFRLREIIPTLQIMEKKPTKLEILKHTCEYITRLRETLTKLEEMKRKVMEEEKKVAKITRI